MLRLRQYKPCDAKNIVSWIKDEETLKKWSADRFGEFPISADDINKKYLENNGDCVEEDNFYPFTAFDENGVVGHLILRFVDEEKKILRVGFVIIDDSKRGKGYGKEMLRLALKYAFDILKAQKVTLGVFENNLSALRCYKSVGFVEVGAESFEIMGEEWKCMELEIGATSNNKK